MKEDAKKQLNYNLFGNTWLMGVLIIFLYSAISGAAGSIVPGIGACLVIGPLSYGVSSAFLRNARNGEDLQVGNLFDGFQIFGQTFILGLMQSLLIALWSLLLVVPGIIKAYAYSQAFYIQCDHPEYGWRQCLEESKMMMQGRKMELFILDLSFIGWYLLGTLCLGIGTLWVEAYRFAARTQFYLSIAPQPVPERNEEMYNYAAYTEVPAENTVETTSEENGSL